MAKKLGIFVSTEGHLDKLLGILEACRDKGIEAKVFLTHRGVLLTQDPRFEELTRLGHIALCNVGFESHGLKRPVKGMDEKDYATQARHAEILEECDRYISL
jgi:hypothetical protein